MKKWSLLLLICAMSLSLLAGCTVKTPATIPTAERPSETAPAETESVVSILGTWKYRGELDCAYIFAEDGTGVYRYSGVDMPFTYTDDGSMVSILFEGNTAPNELKYTIAEQILSIEDSFGSVVEYDLVVETN